MITAWRDPTFALKWSEEPLPDSFIVKRLHGKLFSPKNELQQLQQIFKWLNWKKIECKKKRKKTLNAATRNCVHVYVLTTSARSARPEWEILVHQTDYKMQIFSN